MSELERLRAQKAAALAALSEAPDLLLEDYSKRQVKALVSAMLAAYAALSDVPAS